MKLFDSRQHGLMSEAELFIVEGDSAAEAVCAVRDPRTQAVLPLQGKPPNASKVSAGRVAASPFLAGLTQALGTAPGTALPFDELRYARVIILMDPDADGIHAGALLQIFLLRYMPALFDSGQVLIVHPPWAQISLPNGQLQLSFTAAEFRAQCQALESQTVSFERLRFRGLGNMTPAVLERSCVNASTRRAHVLSRADAQMAQKVFGSAD